MQFQTLSGPQYMHTCVQWVSFVVFSAAMSASACAQSQPAPAAMHIAAAGNTTGDAVSFSREIIPVITKAGCNSGACHGASAGRGYLKLSLFGSRPRKDYEAIAHSAAARLLDSESPDSSLLLQKPSGQLEHGGGQRIETGTAEYALLRRWIQSDAILGNLAAIQSLASSAPGAIEMVVGDSRTVRFNVTYEPTKADGRATTEPAVLNWLVIEGAGQHATPRSDLQSPVSYTVSGDGIRFHANRAGYWPVNIRYASTAVAIQFFVRASAENVAAKPAHEHSIDQLVIHAAQRIGVSAAEGCDPHVLARRLWIDLLGRHPNKDEWSTAVLAIQQGRLKVLVDSMLEMPQFASRAAREIASWTGKTGSPGLATFQDEIEQQLLQGDNLQTLARKALLVEGDLPGLRGFHLLAQNARQRSELVASTWLGTRIGCAQCHDHPLDRWTQDDYFGLAACWAEIDLSRGSPVRVAGKTTTDLRQGKPAVAKLVLGKQLSGRVPPDVELIEWTTSSDNKLFTNNAANRVWYWLMGTGIVEDVDDFRGTNPPINPELLRLLTTSLRESEFSLKNLVRLIVTSEAYARQTDDQQSGLSDRLALTRSAKPIGLPVVELLSHMFELDTILAEVSADGPSMMTNAEGCSRASNCADPFSESIAIAADPRLNNLLVRGITLLRQRNPDASMKKLTEQLHVLFFGEPLTADRRHEVERIFGANSWETPPPSSTPLEDIAWSWAVNEQFRLLQ